MVFWNNHALLPKAYDPQGEGASLFSVGRLLYKHGDKQRAFEFLEESLSIFQFLGDPRAELVHQVLSDWRKIDQVS